jgi:tryptophan synthase beta chain
MSPLVSAALIEGLITPRAVGQIECYKAAIQWARSEGFLVAPETSHAVAVTIQEALKAKEEGKEKVILMNLSGHGHMDLLGYQKYLAGELKDITLPQAEIEKAEEELSKFPKPSLAKTGKW